MQTFFAKSVSQQSLLYKAVCLLHVYKEHDTQQRKIKPIIGFCPPIFIDDSNQKNNILFNCVYNAVIVPEQT